MEKKYNPNLGPNPKVFINKSFGRARNPFLKGFLAAGGIILLQFS